jgi:CsoR family transcriptional regulator, copper-sensing transcriptional repressor
MMKPDNKRELVNRLRSIQGHLKGIERMVEEDQYCIDILKQTDAVARALARVDALILGNHLDTCVTTAIRGDDPAERERVLGELMQVFQQSDKL